MVSRGRKLILQTGKMIFRWQIFISRVGKVASAVGKIRFRHWRATRVFRSAGFQTCCIADFPIGAAWEVRKAQVSSTARRLEARDTADWEVCATFPHCPPAARRSSRRNAVVGIRRANGQLNGKQVSYGQRNKLCNCCLTGRGSGVMG
jgi:hypothetical protein